MHSQRNIHPIYQILWVYFRIRCNICSHYVCIIYFYILNFFRPRGFSVQEVFPSNVWSQNKIFSGKMTILSYKTNFLPTFSAIIENSVEKFFCKVPKTLILVQKRQNGYFWPNLSLKSYFYANFLHFWLNICKYIKTT